MSLRIFIFGLLRRASAERKHIVSVLTFTVPMAAHVFAPGLEAIAFIVVGVLAIEAA